MYLEKNSIKVQTQNGHMVTERIWRVICDSPFRLVLYRSSSHSTVTLNLLPCMPFILVWPVVCTPTASTGLPHTLSALPGSLFGSLVWGFQNKTPQYMTFRLVAFFLLLLRRGIDFVCIDLTQKKKKKSVIHCWFNVAGEDVKSMIRGKKLQSQLWVLTVSFLVLFHILFSPMGGSTCLDFILFFCVQHISCKIRHLCVASWKLSVEPTRHWPSVARRGYRGSRTT